MKKLNVNVLALALGITFALTTAARIENSGQWVYDSALGSELSASAYVQGSVGSCANGGNICGIVAGEDPNNEGHPLISEAQLGRIQSRQTSQGDVFLKN